MRALVLATFLALAAASSDVGGDAGSASPPSPGDRRRTRRAHTIASHHAHWFLAEANDRPSGSPHARDHEDASARLERIAADVVSLDADIVHVFGLDGCGSLRKLAAACTSADPSVSTDWRPYLLAPSPVPVPPRDRSEDDARSHASDADDAETALRPRRLGSLSRVDPVAPLRASPGATADPSAPAHHVAEIVVGRVPVAVFAVASRSAHEQHSKTQNPHIDTLAADVRARVAAGEQVVVVGVGVDGRDAARRVAASSSSNSSPTLVSLARDAAWATEGFVAAIDRAESNPTPAGGRLELRFRPGRFTNEAETWREYWTLERTHRVAWEATCAVAFFAGIYRLVWPGAYESRPNLVGDFYGFGTGYPAFHAREERRREALLGGRTARGRDGKKHT